MMVEFARYRAHIQDHPAEECHVPRTGPGTAAPRVPRFCTSIIRGPNREADHSARESSLLADRHQPPHARPAPVACYHDDMSPEAWTIPGAAIAIAGLLVGLVAWLRGDMKDRFTRLEDGQARLETRLLAMEKEQAHTSGLLESLGLTGHAEPAPSASD